MLFITSLTLFFPSALLLLSASPLLRHDGQLHSSCCAKIITTLHYCNISDSTAMGSDLIQSLYVHPFSLLPECHQKFLENLWFMNWWSQSFPAVLLMHCLKLSGPCTFESNQCQWADSSDGQSRWQRQKASNNTEPPTDHTTGTGDFSGF